MSKEYTLRVGESGVLRRRFFARSWTVGYAGMPSEKAYSLFVTWSMGHQSAAYNLFLTLDQREVALAGGRLRVLDLSARELRLRFDAGG